MDSEPAIAFSNQRPFFPMVATFMLSATGLGPLYQSDNPLRLSKRDCVSCHGLIEPQLDIDLEQIRQMTQHLDLGTAVQQLCGMLMISTHAVALDLARNDPRILESPEMEFFRHVRNAAAHGNRFTFVGAEPRRHAAWRTVNINQTAHNGTQCFGKLLNAADALALLGDIEQMLPASANTAPTGEARAMVDI